MKMNKMKEEGWLATVLEHAGRKIFKLHLKNIFFVFLLVIVCLKVGNKVSLCKAKML